MACCFAPLVCSSSEYPSLKDLYLEWSDGVRMKAGNKVSRIAPLRMLGYLQVLAGGPVWRCGDRMKNEINRRKTVIDAIHRRAVGGNVTVAEAIAQLEAACTKHGKVMGVSAMATALTTSG
jgi:hypothetical protein